MKKLFQAILVVSTSLVALPAGAETLLLRYPDVSDESIVFSYGADIWIAGRDGGDARRLTSFPGIESGPKLSPDGRLVAFQGQYDGNIDIYVVPVTGSTSMRSTSSTSLGWSTRVAPPPTT